ncbi:hypothetical protein [Nonlabens antarcticus]|uniref:hypothetical protein n=1 Tax=Nonlabens antarcticus TaxID=392714 RepID=UPI0018913668|nr:hypothetical protein [Nonlabens antarcticus]
MKDQLLKYLRSDRHLWWTVSIIPGIYSILYLYTNNFTLVNSWYQLAGFLFMFIVVPVTGILFLDAIFKKYFPQHRGKLYWTYLIINFAIILSLCLFLGWRWKGLLLVGSIAVATSFFIAKHYKILVIIVCLMTGLAVFNFLYFYVERISSHEPWPVTQDYESLVFKKKPNIYLIQPDGFVSRKTAANDLYQWKGTEFYNELGRMNFLINDDYRSNYPTTLTSNSALFTSQHHYYDNGKMQGELYNARNIITGNNAVLTTLKSNGYQLNAILEHRYLLLNHPKTFYDYLNVSQTELSFLPNYVLNKDYKKDLYSKMESANKGPQFYFVEILKPGHISVNSSSTKTVKDERRDYIERMDQMTDELMTMMKTISDRDPGAVILIISDHGGFVGYSSTEEAYEKPTEELALKQSLFNSLLAIKAPQDFQPYNDNIKTAVGVFPNLFYYLAGQPVPQQTLDNSSYIFIKKGDAPGVYKYFNTDGEPVTEKLDP